jgi:hypothetical protein
MSLQDAALVTVANILGKAGARMGRARTAAGPHAAVVETKRRVVPVVSVALSVNPQAARGEVRVAGVGRVARFTLRGVNRVTAELMSVRLVDDGTIIACWSVHRAVLLVCRGIPVLCRFGTTRRDEHQSH